MEKCQLLFWDTWNVTGIRKMANGTWKLQNKYYHLSKTCIYTRCQLYKFPKDLATLQLPMNKVPPTVQDTIRKEFGLEV